MFGYRPPPYFGPATAYQALLRSAFARQFDVTFINLSVVRELRELEKFGPGKLLKLLKFLALEFWYLLSRRPDFVCYPVSFNRNAFLKDALLLAVARAWRCPTVLWAHGNNLPDFRERSPRWLQRLIDRTISSATAAIVLGERLRFNFERHLPAERIFVVPLGIEPPANLPPRQPGNTVSVLYLGNLVREKGVFVLLEAAAQCPHIRFVFAGAWFRAEDEAAAKQAAPANAEFVGPVTGDAKWQTLAHADLLAFPTFYYYETFGLVLLEAMAAGLPVVTTRRAAIPEIVEEGVNGLFVEEQNAADLAEKILRLAGDAALRGRMGRANREKFAAFYTHEQYGARMIEVFETLSRRLHDA
jgi:glycosyltransferase involved in cell wall biosynthesis